ncbi:MAG TPA: S49 family peptidase [Granulicella sp.]
MPEINAFLSALLSRSPLWAIRPEALQQAMLKAVSNPTGQQVAKLSVAGTDRSRVVTIPIEGVLTKDGPSWYGSNYDTLARQVETAAKDPSVRRIVLSVDSPGGEVIGLPETASVIARARQTKPVDAVVTGQAASAAYWLASQASSIALTPSGEVGSIGVRMAHTDISQMLDKAGVKITELYSGDFKTEWSPFKPLSEDARDAMQPRLEAMHNEFLGAVASGRGTRAAALQAQRFGEGRMFSAPEALKHGLVDSVLAPADYYRGILPPAVRTAS